MLPTIEARDYINGVPLLPWECAWGMFVAMVSGLPHEHPWEHVSMTYPEPLLPGIARELPQYFAQQLALTPTLPVVLTPESVPFNEFVRLLLEEIPCLVGLSGSNFVGVANFLNTTSQHITIYTNYTVGKPNGSAEVHIVEYPIAAPELLVFGHKVQ